MSRAALAAGLGLLLMAVLAGLATFGVVERLVSTDAAETTTRLLSNQRAFVLAIVALLAVVCLGAAGLLRDGAAADEISPSVYAQITEFEEIWSLGLILFGVHC